LVFTHMAAHYDRISTLDTNRGSYVVKSAAM
jgi:hypothetical protein